MLGTLNSLEIEDHGYDQGFGDGEAYFYGFGMPNGSGAGTKVLGG